MINCYSKNVKIEFLSQKMRNDLKRVQKKNLQVFFQMYNKIFILSFRDLKDFSTKNVVLLRFRSNANLHIFPKILRKLPEIIFDFFVFLRIF